MAGDDRNMRLNCELTPTPIHSSDRLVTLLAPTVCSCGLKPWWVGRPWNCLHAPGAASAESSGAMLRAPARAASSGAAFHAKDAAGVALQRRITLATSVCRPRLAVDG